MLQLNGFSTAISEASLTVLKAKVAPADVKKTRKKLGNAWFTMYYEGYLYSLAKDPATSGGLGETELLVLSDYPGLRFVSAMLTEAMPKVFGEYDPVRDRPFAFLAQKVELVASATKSWQTTPSLVSAFEIRPKYELQPKLVELRNGDLEIAVVLGLATRWICNAEVMDLVAAGISVRGMHVIRKNTEPGQRRLVGRINRIDGDRLILNEAFDEQDEIKADEVRVEGSKEIFATCLRHVLNKRYHAFMQAVDAELGSLCSGPGLDSELNKMQVFLQRHSPIKLPGGVDVEIGERIQLRNLDGYKTIVRLPAGKYCFDRSRTKLNNYAWPGLSQFGPFDRESFPTRSPRILVVCPDTVAGRVSQSLKLFRDGITSISDSRYVGFTDTFRLANPEFVPLQVELFGVNNSDVAKTYRTAIEDALARDGSYDAAFNILLDEHSSLPDSHNPYLVAKSVLLSNGIAVQEARISTLTKPETNLQYIFQNIATALYAKMGGVPWTVDHGETVDDELVIGIGNAELSGSRFEKRQRHIGITTVFRGDGNYLLSSLSRECAYDDYPDVLRDSTVKVLREIKTRNNWQPGQTVRIVFHAYKPLKDVEVADIIASSVNEVGNEQNIEFAFLTVSLDHTFTMLDSAQSGFKNYSGGMKGVYVPDRGVVVQLGQYTRLITTTSAKMVKRPNLPLPRPLLIHLHKQSTYRDLSYLAEQCLKFTTLSWRSTLPTEKPVTILYSSLIAELLGRLKVIDDWSPAVLNTKLRNSKWFL